MLASELARRYHSCVASSRLSAGLAAFVVVLSTSCASEFSTISRADGGPSDGGSTGTGGKATGGVRATGGRRATGGTTATGGVQSSGGIGGDGGSSGGSAGSGGVGGSGGTMTTGGSSSTGGNASGGATSSGGVTGSGGVNATGGNTGSGGSGTCGTLTTLTFVDGGFESGDPVDVLPGWEGAPNPPYYSALSTSAARSGTYGVEFNDTGTGVPGIQQKIPVTPAVVGKVVSVTAWFRLVSFPGMRLFLAADTASGIHAATDIMDTDPAKPGFQQLSVSVTIPSNADHLLIQLASAVATADGIAHADDVQVCMDGLCSACP
jgi:hypothetical protein